MEYCSGGDLDKIMNKSKTIVEDELLKITLHVMKALEKLHKENLIHRDIKPSNIFLSDDGAYKLGDYSTVRKMDLGNTTISGTPGYIAPEILNGEKYTVAVDMFSFGCILYHGITGHHPFESETGLINLTKLVLCKYTPIETNKYSKELVDFCHRMLSLNPKNRPSVSEILSNPLMSRVEEKMKIELEISKPFKQTIVSLNREISDLKEEIIN